MKKSLLFLLLTLLALTGTALAAQYTDGTVWDTDETAYYALDPAAPAPLVAPGGNSALTPLGDPSNLRWNAETPGEALWETAGAFQQKVQIDFYQVGASRPLYRICKTFRVGSSFTSFSERSFPYELLDDTAEAIPFLPSGDYYFTIQNLGDGIEYVDSDQISSEDMPGGIFHYAAPEARLIPPGQVRWSWPAILREDLSGIDERIYGYYVDYGYSSVPAQNLEAIAVVGGEVGGRGVYSGYRSPAYLALLADEHGAGWYYFRIRALSENICQWQNSPWSAWSEGYHLSDASRKILDSLDNILKTARPEDIRQKVQALYRAKLASALAAETGADEILLSLEEALGGSARPKVSDPDLEKIFGMNKAAVAGAALNDTTGTEPPVLNIGRAKNPHDVREEMYSSTLVVDFSMDLENVEDVHDLAVPIKVTLPVPQTINPAFLAVLHYKADGSFTEVSHVIFQENGQWYTSFVLTGFSDFTLTQAIPKNGPPF